ncbi:uncharacterized protein LOC130743008 [Lotus japonicus]|uniref:uncharacterized protein LOC130743008 n=1 Tax=Lotus japonicus TaxID=34305 RepID=UPI002583B346|nr:uncharacterized protein LOC130743008 [Lotus japonicus]
MFFYDGMKSNMTCAMKLDTSRKGWYETMSKILGQRQGISYDWDAKEGMLYISGKIDPQKILKIAKNDKKVEIHYMKTADPYASAVDHRGYYAPRPQCPSTSMAPYYSYHDYNTSYPPQLPYYY